MTLLEVEDLTVVIGQTAVVRGVSFAVDAGEAVAVVGESGSGKSVTALSVLGLLPDAAKVTGSIRFDGEELVGQSDKQLAKIRGAGVSMVFQDPLSSLTPVYTVGDQIAEALLVHAGRNGRPHLSKQQARERAAELLDLVGVPDPRQRAKSFPHQLSGGQRQRVMIAMAIANDPKLIIADEPTTALDVTVQAKILRLLRTAQEITGAAVVLITHDLGVVAEFADRALVMYAGRVVESAPLEPLFAGPRMPYTLGLLGAVPRIDAPIGTRLVPVPGTPPLPSALPPGCSFAPRCPMKIDRCDEAEPPLQQVAQRHAAACVRSGELAGADAAGVYQVPSRNEPPARPADPAVVVSVEDLRRTYPVTKGLVFKRKVGEVNAVAGVSFQVREGEALGLVGESGCGKTTTIMEIMALQAPQSGRIEILGQDVAALSPHEHRELRKHIQIVFQDSMAALDPRLPAADILAEPLRLFGMPEEQRHTRVLELLDLVGLRPGHLGRFPAQFSGGQRQRLCIARALALEPKILVLDEPVSALDVSIQAGVLNLLSDLRAELGLSYLFVSHDLALVKQVCDHVAVMRAGEIVEAGPVAEVYADPQHEYTRELMSSVPVPDPAAARARRES
ncbi:ABC transporter ATP-binding protein [Segniliparus rugosus]|uniref:Oligopeptide/dipeptide ABC transporter, ATP-binding protein domain n=1 Tax=Segniliparus rugosus (strain ATCC BAA-974 / DSM 45345 / CCUG 50838 / CIP 108380 / JCM 13579 / CDC 945) TaxID=679197 RepID=E5XML1_SEGRC|nr:ABC transporter ATP-binding protein [Segniliparus rugosus]EFV14407.1 oligopeptide/dipeptide ABC transporter, ATP-binding protein domain [Segniliparus rugosus ATCC BAA-974]